ncbi:unnamed protein product, partial [Rotaria sp. Silwood2]
RDICAVRLDAQECYEQVARDRFEPLLRSLEDLRKAEYAACQSIHIVLADFECTNEAEIWICRRRVMHGFE